MVYLYVVCGECCNFGYIDRSVVVVLSPPPPLYFFVENSIYTKYTRNELTHLVMGTIFLVSIPPISQCYRVFYVNTYQTVSRICDTRALYSEMSVHNFVTVFFNKSHPKLEEYR